MQRREDRQKQALREPHPQEGVLVRLQHQAVDCEVGPPEMRSYALQSADHVNTARNIS
jgi:hypothetical protein